MSVSHATVGFDFTLASCTRCLSYKVAKRLLDVVVAGTALVVLFPLLVAIAIAVRCSSPGPVFYEWRVVGKGGKRFTGYKFRTMVVNADELKEDLWQYSERNGPTFKMRHDPRITGVGRFLRKFSLDELPQLWSVLKGDMSIVGPRPVGPDEWLRFEPWQRRKLSVVPGGICLWHVRGKPSEFNDWMKLDLEYVDNWSFWLDFRIIIGGVRYVLTGKNY